MASEIVIADDREFMRLSLRMVIDSQSHLRVAAAHRIHRVDPGSRVILMTTFDHAAGEALGAAAGVKGVLLKDIPPAGLLEAIRTVAAGHELRPSVAPGHQDSGG